MTAAPRDETPDARILAARRRARWSPVVVSAILFVLGVYPGSVFTSGCCTAPFLGLCGLVWAVFWLRDVGVSRTPFPVASLFALLVIVVGLAANRYLAARAAFPLFRPAFERVAAATRPEDPRRTGWVGIYKADIEADPRGGVYFRINSMLVMIDEDSCGFAWKANRDGTPFGNAHFRLTPLGGDWSVFHANDDW